MDTLVKTVLASSQIPQNYQEDEIMPVEEEVSSLLKLIPKFQAILKVKYNRVHGESLCFRDLD